MKDRDIINLFDQVDSETLAETDLISGQALPGLESAGKGALEKARTGQSPGPKPRRFSIPSWQGLVAAAAALAIVLFSVFSAKAPQSARAIARPDYPEGVSYHDYDGKRAKRQVVSPDFLTGLSQFSFTSAAEVFALGERSVNSVYSPLSLFYALALASEGAAGSTQAELLQALHMPNIDLVRSESSKLFKNLFTDNEIGKLLLANSLWLQEDVAFNKAFLERAARDYFAHSFSVDFADPKTAKQISQWVSENTGGKLGNDPREFQASPEQVMSIINTVYFYDQWSTEFDHKLTKKDIFSLADGSKVKVPFMNRTFMGAYVQEEDCLITALNFKNDQRMLLVLPDKGVSPYDILSDPGRLEDVLTAMNSESAKGGEIILSVPKFNFETKHDLNNVLKKLGAEQAFTEQADFTGLASTKPLFISDVRQNLSISIDEKGCEAAAYTEIRLLGCMPPNEPIEVKLDRPFIFAIIGGAGDAPLFIGVVNNPAAK